MYFYLFDSFLSDKKYEKILDKIQKRIVDLGIEGKIENLSILKNLDELIKSAVKKGFKTIVAVGNDQIISQVINAVANSDVVLGIIPVGKNNKIANLLGVPEGELSCDVISNRLIEKIDLGKVNNHYFLTSLKIVNHDVILECDDNYRIIPAPEQEINIFNLGWQNNKTFNPRDGILEISIMLPSSLKSIFKTKSRSLFPVKKIKLIELDKENPVNVIANGLKVLKRPIIIQVAPQKLKVIVGKERKF